MKFRTKLLILLLSITLIPLSLSFLSQRTSVLHFGNKLAGDTRELLNSSAITLLHALVNDYSRILKRDKAMAELTLQIQAMAVEQRLFGRDFEKHHIYFSEDYASPQRQPKDLTSTSKRLRQLPDGTLVPIPVSYSQQVIFLAGKKKPGQVAEELERMSSMPDVYRTLHDIQPDLFLWHYTSLASGIHSSYPGKGGYPAEYDPRQRPWYQGAVQKGGTSELTLTDLSTGTLIMTLAKPIYSASGKLAGVTALDIDYRQFFSDWIIPADWAADSESMVLVFHETAQEQNLKLQILLRSQNERHHLDWRMPVIPEYLDIEDPELQDIARDIQQGVSAVRRITYQGKDSLWAYGARTPGAPFPLVIVPYQKILAKAIDAENYVNQQISLGLSISAILTIVVVVAAILLAISRSSRVTLPILQIADAAERLAEGDFDSRVQIKTGDEIENLGRVFNDMGRRLKERELMLQSLALAREIQQQLLPESAPQCRNFDLAASSHYCDETGGDYFDFIELKTSGQNHLGLAVGDVSGHGIGAALVMATARGVLHSLVERHGSDLEALCGELNYRLSRSTSDAYFMTLFYGHLDPDKRTLRWASAGHAPLFLYRAEGRIEELYSTGIPFGIIEDSLYEVAPLLSFSTGDFMLIGTDGIWETSNAEGEMFGTARVRELLLRYATADAETIIKQILDALNLFRTERPADDDITLMVIKAL